MWALIWLLILIFVGWEIAFFCCSWYVCCLPFEVCIEALKPLNEILLTGVKLPRAFARHMMNGESGWNADLMKD